ncbi:hypothetical protein [Bradyrhizobium ottawaense]|uniref:DUF2188 domain-containing protein n=1 Tax=Bradyrhizobium ottawaense TaxID=931866 RepID=A0ABV4G2C0_9BRAD|nr:hypothetical protein BwSH14_43590 [Bradyrhizobium ottawaense]GMO40858.1 hypothetical protein BwSF12_43430 [Bradyrhizobium ottawaense]GMO85753.1 hypothetical protein BwSF19_44740 [Bradyrhizobium ottawaense]GMO87598.1 hypothetical protein BwSH17_72150 [Bradyrhizobium ottawaense]
MTFTIGCRYRDYDKKSFTVEKETAAEALATSENLERSDVEIEYVDTPEHGRLDMWGFRRLYK